MAGEKRNKLKNILGDWPSCLVVTYPWLKEKGIYQQLVDTYVKHGWLQKLAAGLFARAGDHPNQYHFIAALQSQLNLPIHIGGRTAVEIRGHGHYVRFNTTLDLFSPTHAKLPSWCKTVFTSASVRYFTVSSLLNESNNMEGIAHFSVESQTLNVSSLERAILEMLYFVPQHYTYEESAHIMENLTLLRPTLIQSLLMHCKSVKTKRLFLHLATLCGHAWINELNLNEMDLGHGVRKIANGTVYDKAYQLYVPINPLNE